MAIELTFSIGIESKLSEESGLELTTSIVSEILIVSSKICCYQFLYFTPSLDVNSFCPGSVFFTPTTITWYLPKHIDPLISSGQFRLLEVRMGIDGQRLDAAEMAARQYSLFINDRHIIVEIPVGAVGGHFKVGGTFTVFFKICYLCIFKNLHSKVELI